MTRIPELVAHDAGGTPVTVKYHVLPALLLADVQRLERERNAQRETIDALMARVAALERAQAARPAGPPPSPSPR